jgi:hypothetical protein
MITKQEFIDYINQGYAFKGDFITLGTAIFGDEEPCGAGFLSF